VVVAEIEYVRKTFSDRKAEQPNRYIAGDTRGFRFNEEGILPQENDVRVHSVSDPKFIKVVSVPAEQLENNFA